MIDLPISGPTNRFLVRERDRRWPYALTAALALAATLLLALVLVGWPRLKSVSIHYDLIRLRAEVAGLRQEERRLEVELARTRNPVALGARARRLGLVPPPPPLTPGSPPAEEGR